MGNKVLVPLDGSELAEAALAYAERLNKALGWTVVLLQVAQPPSAHHGHGGNPLLEGSLQEQRQEMAGGPLAYEEIRRREAAAMESLAGAEDRLRAAGVTAVREVGIGKPDEVIVERAAEDDVAVIVLASHGRGRVWRGCSAAASQTPWCATRRARRWWFGRSATPTSGSTWSTPRSSRRATWTPCAAPWSRRR